MATVQPIIWEIEGYIRGVSRQIHPQIIPTTINQIVALFYGHLWRTYDHKPGDQLRNSLIYLDNSIWCSTVHKSSKSNSKNGIVQFDCNSNQVTNIIEYPETLIPKGHTCCQYNDKIYLIDGVNGKITEFDPLLKTFITKIDIPKIHGFPSAIQIFDKVHIMFGRDNASKYFIYDPIKNTLAEFESDTKEKIASCSILKYKNHIIRFGGHSYEPELKQNPYLDTCMITSKIEPHDDNAPQWTTKNEWNLPQCINQFGVILYGHYVLIFGGGLYVDRKRTYQDSVYLLDLTLNDGWKLLNHIKCPMKSWYLATMTGDNQVHLIARQNAKKDTGHYSLPISTILGSAFFMKG